MKSFVNLLLVSLLALINSCLCDEILGCNGFIKSEVGLSFSSVEVQLYTKQGALKEHTDCAPSNGYFFLPIYDKGEYILKVSPPNGWKFEPTEVPILFDGVSDPCSKGKDINFNFMGFAVDGQVVSSGFSVGPKDVTVELYSHGSNSPTLVTTTGANGNFLFSPVLPGSYKVKISHPRWKPEKNEASVVVKDANGKIPVGSLSIAGYDITGMVTSDSQPITGVSFVLYSKNQQAKVSGCDQSALPGFKVDASLGVVPICHVMSNAQGVFYFPQISPGDYHLVPHYKGSESTKFDVHPKSLSITVGHSSLHLSSAFQVKGFTVAGKVLWSPKGKPMKGATIYLNGKMVSKSGNDGVFSLESMRARTYTIKIEAENVVFKESEVKVSSTSLPDFYPISYKVCGRFHSPTASGPYRIELTSEDSTKSEVSTDSNGSYCLYLAPGKYTFTPDPDSARLSSGLLFSPSKRLVQVEDQPLNNIDFSQLRSTVKGKILCMTQCPLITVNLKPKSQGATALQIIAKNGHYEFTEVMPGDYDIYLEPGLGWCWDKDSQSLTVINEVTEVLAFTQTGFIVTIVSSHSTSVVYFSEGQTNDKLKLEVVPGSTHICVPKSTPYIFQPVGCHGYEQPQFRWVTGTVNLNAVTHANAFFFLASEEITDLTLNVEPVESAETSHPKVLAPGPGVKVEEGIKYEIELQLRPNEKLKITPVAGIFLFTPQSAEVKGHTDCFNSSKSLFSAEKGQIITGKVLSGENKGISGVTITIKDEMGAVVASEATDATGAYKFPPLKALPNIKIIAEKEGYVLTHLAKFGDFSAHKLAEIIVTVSDEATKEKLQGVLLSLSGGKSYRRNAQTSAEGTMSFLSLSPGEYFLKPMMKEYKFHPQNKIINVKEGATVTVNLSGERVAYSGIGEVTSLSGEGEGGVVVEAIGVGDCAAYQEESTSNESGLFRIRGLKPNCEYNVRVKEGVDVNHHILKSGQDTVPIKVKMADVSGLKLYVLRPSTRVDVMVYVVADRAEDLKTLRLRLTREDSPDVAVSVMKLSEYKPSPSGYALTSVMIVLPPLPADGRSYVLQLESSLPLGTHEYINRPVHFKASGSLKVFRMAFSPNLKSRDPDLSQSSYLVLPFLILVGITFYNKDAVIGLATSALEKSRPATVTAKPTTDDTMVPDLFPEFPKKKSKSRKT